MRCDPVSALLVGAVAGVAVLGAAPVLLTAPAPAAMAAVSVYAVAGVVCHQQPSRSFRPGGLALPVCARCTGLYAAVPLGVAAAAVRRRRLHISTVRRWPLLLAAAPTLVTVILEWLGVDISNIVRAGAAVPLGAVVAWYVAAAVKTLGESRTVASGSTLGG